MSSYNPSPAFEHAAAYLSSSSSINQVSNTLKLELYGLFKYLTVSKAPISSRPSIFDMTDRAKWEAWNGISKKYENPENVEARYLEIAQQLGWTKGTVSVTQDPGDGDIWGDEPSPKSRDGGMGLSVSSMARPPTVNDSSVHGLTIEGEIANLTKLLEDKPETNLNQLDEYGYTPLHLACDRGHTEIVKFLLLKGADPTIKDPDDLSPLELAQVTENEDIIKLLSSPR